MVLRNEGGALTATVDLTNCDREPIHIPGSVQPHGALMAFDSEKILVAHSSNIRDILGVTPSIGESISSIPVNRPIKQAVNSLIDNPGGFVEPMGIKIGGKMFDAISHRTERWAVVEIESRPPGAPSLHTFAYKAQNSLAKLQTAQNIERLLTIATAEVSHLTGFDRVMLYQFRHDDSGEVVVEEKLEKLAPFLGLRYPTSDIPAQARRLYILNTLRFITDVEAIPSLLIPPLGPDSARPMDLSHATLRSVSPIHVEYLRNMAVTASLSISIVVDGRLWGLFACHHYSGPRTVPHAVRIACKLLAQTVSSLVERFETRRRVEIIENSRTKREALLESVRESANIFTALFADNQLSELIHSDGFACSSDGRTATAGSVPPPDFLASLIDDLLTNNEDVIHSNEIGNSYPFAGDPGNIAGLLGIRFEKEPDSWVFWFRRAEIETVRWAGRPEKEFKEGPHGPRLSPRGSFAEYKDQVQGIASPWDAAEIETASLLRIGLQGVSLSRVNEFNRARELLVAALGHDLRNPLQAINMSAYVLGEDNVGARELSGKISRYSHRMKRLIDHMLDFSRVQSGLNLGVNPSKVNPCETLSQVLDEVQTAHPGFDVQVVDRMNGLAFIDPERFADVVANLLSNAMHHGDTSIPTKLTLTGGGSEPFEFKIENKGQEISKDRQKNLFQPFKGTTQEKSNRKGLGLGLFLVSQILAEHQGRIEVGPYSEGIVSFIATFPPG